MSNKVKERLEKLKLELTHEERVKLDAALENLFLKAGGIIINKEKGCDKIIDEITDDKIREIVGKIKKKRKKVAVAQD
jgi:hypothetical protein